MVEVEIDAKLISSFTKKANDPKATSEVKKLLKEWSKSVKGYVIRASDGKHFVVVEDKAKFEELLEKIKKVAE